MRLLSIILIILSSFTIVLPAFSGQQKLPYYASIKTDEANIRTGPSVKHPIHWVYHKVNWPVRVTASFEHWRKIEDIYGEIGWLHESLLSGKRGAIIKSKEPQKAYRFPVDTSAVAFIAEPGVMVEVLSCKNDWCKIKADDEKGWIRYENLWGVDRGEIIG